MTTSLVALALSLFTGVGFFVSLGIFIIVILANIGDYDRPSHGWATLFFLAILGIVQLNFHLPATDWLIVLPAWLLCGVIYSAFAWYRAAVRLRTRVTDWFNPALARLAKMGTTGDRVYERFPFLGESHTIEIDTTNGKTPPDLQGLLTTLANDLRPSHHVSFFGFWILLWPLYLLRELTRNLVANIVDALSGMYTRLAKKAMGVG